MGGTDRRPLPNSPVTRRITQRANNRLGAVVSSLYGFWTAHDAALRSNAASIRRDAYTVILFNSTASVRAFLIPYACLLPLRLYLPTTRPITRISWSILCSVKPVVMAEPTLRTLCRQLKGKWREHGSLKGVWCGTFSSKLTIL